MAGFNVLWVATVLVVELVSMALGQSVWLNCVHGGATVTKYSWVPLMEIPTSIACDVRPFYLLSRKR